MAGSDMRLRYFNGQVLQQEDFIQEQEYHLDRLHRHFRQLHTPGIAEGLTVTANLGDSSATVQPGTAIDNKGRPIVLIEPTTVSFSPVDQRVLVVISYRETPAVPAGMGGEGKTRWLENPEVQAIPDSGGPPSGDQIPLALLRIDSHGAIAEPPNTTVRISAGVKLGTEVPFESIRLSRQGVASNLWPLLSSGAPSQADVTGNLSVTGKILVSGTVDDRDVSADGAKLDRLESSTLEGVSYPGGNIDLVGQNGITVTGDNSAKKITIANPAGSLKVQNPLSDTLQFVKDQAGLQSPIMISTNDVEVNTASERICIFRVVGNVSAAPLMEVRNLKNEASIRYLSLDNADKVAWHVGTGGSAGAKNFFFWNDSASQAVATMTPDGSLTLKGGLTVGGGLSMRRIVVTAGFGRTNVGPDVDVNGTIKTVDTGFQPKLISMEGRAHAWLGKANAYLSYGGAIGGFCHVSDNGVVVRGGGHGPILNRLQNIPYLNFYNETNTATPNAFGRAAFRDDTVTPNKLHVDLEVVIESVTSNGFRMKLVRRTDATFVAPDVFGLDMVFAVLG